MASSMSISTLPWLVFRLGELPGGRLGRGSGLYGLRFFGAAAIFLRDPSKRERFARQRPACNTRSLRYTTLSTMRVAIPGQIFDRPSNTHGVISASAIDWSP